MADELRDRIMRIVTRTQAFGGVVPTEAAELVNDIVEALQPYVQAKRAMDLSGYAVHHINGNPHDNRLENLTLVRVRHVAD